MSDDLDAWDFVAEIVEPVGACTGVDSVAADGDGLAVVLDLKIRAPGELGETIGKFAGRLSVLFEYVNIDWIRVVMREADHRVAWTLEREWAENLAPEEALEKIRSTVELKSV